MSEKKLDPLVPGGPAPTETEADWEAILLKAREAGRTFAYNPAIEQLRYVSSSLEDLKAFGGGRRLSICLYCPPGQDRSKLASGIRAFAAPLFGEISLQWVQ